MVSVDTLDMQELVDYYKHNTLQSVYKEVDTPLLFPFKQAGPYFSVLFLFKYRIREKRIRSKVFYILLKYFQNLDYLIGFQIF